MRLRISNQRCGGGVSEPYRLDVTTKLKLGKNWLVIKVTNLLINRVLGQPVPDVSALVDKFGKRFGQIGERTDLKFTQNSEKSIVKNPVPSGLLEPVEVQATRNV